MTAKHTPGPWIAVGWIVEHPREDISDICSCNPIDFGNKIPRSNAEICANARLIAAAPDLLAALEAFFNPDLDIKETLLDEDQAEVLERAWYAICKAKVGIQL